MTRIKNEVRDAILAKMEPLTKRKTTKVEKVVKTIKKLIKK